MTAFLNALHRFLFWITFGPFRDKRQQVLRRARYEFLKSKISERHFAGYGGLTVDFQEHKFDRTDMESFRPPMYGTVKDMKGRWCIFWDRKKLTQEIGVGAPLKEGEVVTGDSTGRIWTQVDPENIDQQKPLTHQKEQSPNGTESEGT